MHDVSKIPPAGDNIREWLTRAISAGASDLHLVAGYPPVLRLHGDLVKMAEPKLTGEETLHLARSLCSPDAFARLQVQKDIDFSFELAVDGRFCRFRANLFRSEGHHGACVRVVPASIPAFDWAGFPEDLAKRLAFLRDGLVIVTGATGSGKTTTLAMIVNLLNLAGGYRIITVEEPVEYVFPRVAGSVVTQREVGSDVLTFADGLKYGLRQDPDVILVGEMRDYETIETAMTAAETGHLVMSTLHTMDAAETVNRIIGVFPPYHQRQVRIQLAGVIKGVISQRLVPRADGKGRVPAVEVMLGTLRVRECIDDKEKTKQLHDCIAQGYVSYGMQTFDQSLMKLYTSKLITYDEAVRQSTNPDDFALKVSGISGTSDASWDGFEDKGDPAAEPEKLAIEKF